MRVADLKKLKWAIYNQVIPMKKNGCQFHGLNCIAHSLCLKFFASLKALLLVDAPAAIFFWLNFQNGIQPNSITSQNFQLFCTRMVLAPKMES